MRDHDGETRAGVIQGRGVSVQVGPGGLGLGMSVVPRWDGEGGTGKRGTHNRGEEGRGMCTEVEGTGDRRFSRLRKGEIAGPGTRTVTGPGDRRDGSR